MPKEISDSIIEKFLLNVRMGNFIIVDQFLKDGFDVNAKDDRSQDALFYAVAHYRESIIELLINNGADIKTKYQDNKSIFQIAVECNCEEKGHLSIIEKLVSAGVDVKHFDKYHNNCLSYLCAYYTVNVETIKLVLKQGANANILNQFGESPYSAAIKYERNELIDLLRRFSVVQLD